MSNSRFTVKFDNNAKIFNEFMSNFRVLCAQIWAISGDISDIQITISNVQNILYIEEIIMNSNAKM
jgi:hypothetical protein